MDRFGRRSSGFAITGESLDGLYREHAHRMAIRLTRDLFDAATAADLTAIAFARAFERRRQFRGTTRQEAVGWLYTIAQHELSHYVRRGKAETRALTRLGLERPQLDDCELERLEELAEIEQLRREIAEQLQTLSAEHREALQLRVIEERGYAEIAELLGLTEPTVRARVSRAMRALSTRVSVDYAEETS
jgi:RNA polymerase sigma-70 factor (ECF subfamily)